MVVGFTTTYAICAYHHGICEFEFRSDEVQSIQWLAAGRWFFRVLPVPSSKTNWPPRYDWNIVEWGVKQHYSYPNIILASTLPPIIIVKVRFQVIPNTCWLHEKRGGCLIIGRNCLRFILAILRYTDSDYPLVSSNSQSRDTGNIGHTRQDGQSRDTGNIGHTRQDEDKQNTK
jgi:hypothetical protein